MYELKKDISHPGAYYRAGQQKSKEEWEAIFPNAFLLNSNEWFIDLSKLKTKEGQADLVKTVVNEVFEKHQLHSISYKEAAQEACREYLKRKEAQFAAKSNLTNAPK